MSGSEGGITGLTRKVIGATKFWHREEPAAPGGSKVSTDEAAISPQFNPKEFGIDKPVDWKSETLKTARRGRARSPARARNRRPTAASGGSTR